MSNKSSMDFEHALSSARNGVLINVAVTAGSRSVGINGYNKWRRSISVKVTKHAERGKANEQLVKYFAGIFNKSEQEVELVSGAVSSRKVLLVKSVDIEQAKVVLFDKITSTE